MKHIIRDSKTILLIKDFSNNLLKYLNYSKKSFSIVSNKFTNKIKNVKILIFSEIETQGLIEARVI